MGLSLTGILGVIAVSLAAEAAGGASERGDLDGALIRARAACRFVVVLLTGPGAEEAGASDIVRRPEWLRSIHPHDHVVLAADGARSAAVRFGARSFPLFLVLDGEGREIGRIGGEPSVEVVARRLRHIVEAAERHREGRASLEEDPRDAEALFWLGEYRWNQGDHFLAATCFRRVCDLASSGVAVDGEAQAAALGRLGEHALDRGEYVEAEGRFRQALLRTRDAESACGAALGLSLSLRRQGKVSEAVSVLEKTLAAGRASWLDDQALFALGYLRRELGERAQARRLFEECAARFPGSVHGSRARRYVMESEVLAPAVRGRPDFVAAED